jgi:hypothetical protein
MTTDDLLAAERAALRRRHGTRADTAIRLIEDMAGRVAGYAYVALRSGTRAPYPFAAVFNAEIFAREVAPEHHARIAGVLDVLAVAVEDEDPRFAGRFSARQFAQLHHRYRELDDERRRWARAELKRPPAEQLALL